MRRHLTYANLVSTLCLVLLLSGSAYAAAKITGKDIKNSSVSGKDIKDATLSGKDVKDASVSGSDLANNSVSSADLLNNSVSSADLLNNSVTSADLLEGSVTGFDLADDSVTSADVLDSSLTGDDIFVDSVTGADVSGLTVADLSAGALPGAQLTKDGGDVPTGGQTVLDMDGEGFDTGGMSTVGGDVITVPLSGHYLCIATLQWGGGNGGERQLRIAVDNNIVDRVVLTGGSASDTQQLSVVVPLTAGQQVSLGTFHTAGVDVPLTDLSGPNDASLIVQMISP